MHTIQAFHYHFPNALLDIIRVFPNAGLSLTRIARDLLKTLENIMFAFLIEKLSIWFEAAEQRRREAYLAQSTDIVQLEAHPLARIERL